MEAYAYIVAMVLGVMMWLAVMYVYVRHQAIPFNGLALSFFAFLLVSMSVYSSVSISIDADGLKADLAKALETAEQAQSQAAVAREAAAVLESENSKMAQATERLQESFQTLTVQSELKSKGYYGGPLDGSLNAQTKTALRDYQARHNLSTTSTITAETLSTLQVAPVQRLKLARPITRD